MRVRGRVWRVGVKVTAKPFQKPSGALQPAYDGEVTGYSGGYTVVADGAGVERCHTADQLEARKAKR